jgi:hypothetical protein
MTNDFFLIDLALCLIIIRWALTIEIGRARESELVKYGSREAPEKIVSRTLRRRGEPNSIFITSQRGDSYKSSI